MFGRHGIRGVYSSALNEYFCTSEEYFLVIRLLLFFFIITYRRKTLPVDAEKLRVAIALLKHDGSENSR